MASAGDAEVGPDSQRPPAIEDFDEELTLRDFAKAFHKKCLELLGVKVNLITAGWKAKAIAEWSVETGEPKPGYKTYFTPPQEWLPRLDLKALKAMRRYKLMPLMVASVQKQVDEAQRKRNAAAPAPIPAAAAPPDITSAPQQQATSHQPAAPSSEAAPSAGPLSTSPFPMYTTLSYVEGPTMQDSGRSLTMQRPQPPTSHVSQPSSQAQPSNGLQGRGATAGSMQASAAAHMLVDALQNHVGHDASIEGLQAAVIARVKENIKLKQKKERLKAKVFEMKFSKAGMDKENSNTTNKDSSAAAVVVVDDICQSHEGMKTHVRGLLSLFQEKDDDSLHACQVVIQALEMFAVADKKFRDDLLSILGG